MVVSNVHTLYAVNIATVEDVDLFIKQVQSFNYDAGIEELLLSADGDVDPTFVANANQEPKLTFSTSMIATALATVGISGLKISSDVDDDGLEAWFRKVTEGGTRTTGANHLKMTVNEGLLIPTSISAPHNDVARIEYLLVCTYDGTNDPIVIAASQSLEGTTGVSELFTAGPVIINGAQLPGVRDITIDFGLEPLVLGADGDVWPTFAGIKTREPMVTVRCLDIAAINTFGLSGTAQGVTDSLVYLKKFSEGASRVANATAEHISIAVDEGMIWAQNAGGEHNEANECDVMIRPTYDGTNAIFVIDTTAAIVIP